jgi:hypothetical protein
MKYVAIAIASAFIFITEALSMGAVSSDEFIHATLQILDTPKWQHKTFAIAAALTCENNMPMIVGRKRGDEYALVGYGSIPPQAVLSKMQEQWADFSLEKTVLTRIDEFCILAPGGTMDSGPERGPARTLAI